MKTIEVVEGYYTRSELRERERREWESDASLARGVAGRARRGRRRLNAREPRLARRVAMHFCQLKTIMSTLSLIDVYMGMRAFDQHHVIRTQPPPSPDVGWQTSASLRVTSLNPSKPLWLWDGRDIQIARHTLPLPFSSYLIDPFRFFPSHTLSHTHFHLTHHLTTPNQTNFIRNGSQVLRRFQGQSRRVFPCPSHRSYPDLRPSFTLYRLPSLLDPRPLPPPRLPLRLPRPLPPRPRVLTRRRRSPRG